LSHFNEAEVEGCGFKMAFLIAKTSTMAKDKNSFLIYCDIIHTVDKLDDLQAGKLFKHLLKYVNDLNPVADDIVTEIAFEPIRQSLKRDLQKYETIRERNSENAKKRWNATASDRIPNHTKNADSDSVSDSVISKDIYRSFAHLSISNADIEKLLDKYSINEIDEVLDSIENFKGNKKYTSLYLTANKWLSKNKKSTEVEEPKELLLARKLGLC
jgi:hypothetical protein